MQAFKETYSTGETPAIGPDSVTKAQLEDIFPSIKEAHDKTNSFVQDLIDHAKGADWIKITQKIYYDPKEENFVVSWEVGRYKNIEEAQKAMREKEQQNQIRNPGLQKIYNNLK